jgi:hypothetical protein
MLTNLLIAIFCTIILCAFVYIIQNAVKSVKYYDPKYNEEMFKELYTEPTDLNEFLNKTEPEDIEFTIETKKSSKKKSPKKSTAKMESGKNPKSPKKKKDERQ